MQTGKQISSWIFLWAVIFGIDALVHLTWACIVWCLNRNRKHPYLMKPLQNQTPIIYLFVSKRKFYVGPLDILIGRHHQAVHVCTRAGYHSPGGSKWGAGDPYLLCRVGYPPGRPFQVLPAACMHSLLTRLSPLVGWWPWQGVWWAVGGNGLLSMYCVLDTHMSCSGYSLHVGMPCWEPSKAW